MLGGSVRCGALALAAGLIGSVAFAAIAADVPGAQRPAAPNNGGAAPLEIKLSLRNIEERNSVFAGGYEGVACQTERPAGDWTLPDFGDRQPLWAVLQLGGTKRLLVLDRAPETNETLDDLLSGFGEKPTERAAFFTQAYFDANGNGNLLDDPVINGQFDSRGEYGYWARFGPIEASLDLGTGPFPYRFGLYASARTNSTPATPTANLLEEFSCSISPAACYEGEATEDGKRYRIALVDLNAKRSVPRTAGRPAVSDAGHGISEIRFPALRRPCGAGRQDLSRRVESVLRDADALPPSRGWPLHLPPAARAGSFLSEDRGQTDGSRHVRSRTRGPHPRGDVHVFLLRALPKRHGRQRLERARFLR
jgi:hypothetical protein